MVTKKFRRVGSAGNPNDVLEVQIVGGLPADVDPEASTRTLKLRSPSGRRVLVTGGLLDRPLAEPVTDKDGNCIGQAIPTPASKATEGETS